MTERPPRRGPAPEGARGPGLMGDLMGERHGDDDAELMDQIGLGDRATETRRARGIRRPSNLTKARRLGVLAVVLVLTLVAATFAWQKVAPLAQKFSMGQSRDEDYEGEGDEQVTVRIPPGSSAGQVGDILQQADVIKSSSKFSSLAMLDERWNKVQPGEWRLKRRMSVDAALDALTKRRNLKTNGLLIKEGWRKDEVYAAFSKRTKIPVAEFNKVKGSDVGLPAEAGGNLEGWLFPATYEIAPEKKAKDYVKEMVTEQVTNMTNLGIGRDRWQDTITKASIIEVEGVSDDDFGKIGRVIDNRLAQGELLRMDSTVHYIYKKRGRVDTSNAERANPSKYNTYKWPGLPQGPISNPGRNALSAAANPPEGDWFYFVAVDPCAEDTRFTNNYPEHLQNVELFKAWLAEHPDGQCKKPR